MREAKCYNFAVPVMRPRHDALDWGLLACLTLMWGSSYLFIKITVGAIPPLTLVAMRLAVGAVFLAGVIWALGLSLPRRPVVWMHLLALAVLGICMPLYLISWGQQRIDSGLTGILLAFMPLATLLLAHFFVAGERMTGNKLAGFVLGLAGIALLAGPEALKQLAGGSGEFLPRVAVAGGAVCYAVNTVIARLMPRTDARVAAAGTMLIGAALMLPLALLLDAPWTLRPTPLSVAACIWLGLVPTATANIVYFRLIARTGPTFVSLTNYLSPGVAVLAGWLILGETLNEMALLALALILGGIGLATRRRNP